MQWLHSCGSPWTGAAAVSFEIPSLPAYTDDTVFHIFQALWFFLHVDQDFVVVSVLLPSASCRTAL